MSINNVINIKDFIDSYNKPDEKKNDSTRNDNMILDLSDVVTKEELHEKLKLFFDFPKYYGGNLDAMYDCLTDISEETNVTIILPEHWPEYEDKYIKNFIKVCGDAASDNGKLTFLFTYPAL